MTVVQLSRWSKLATLPLVNCIPVRMRLLLRYFWKMIKMAKSWVCVIYSRGMSATFPWDSSQNKTKRTMCQTVLDQSDKNTDKTHSVAD